MTISTNNSPVLSRPIDDWPHSDCAKSVITMMVSEGYSAASIRSTIKTISAFIDWKACQGGDPAQITYDDADRFIESRSEAMALRHDERRSIHRLRLQMIEAGVLHQPVASADPIDGVVDRFATELRRRGFASRTVSAYLRYGRQFLRALWIDATGLSHLQHDDIRSYLVANGHRKRHKAAACNIFASRLRVFLRFCWNAGLTELNLARAVPMVRNYQLASLPSFMSADQLGLVLAACDRATVAGRRDFAVLTLMSRLGLRAKEVALLSLDDIDWHKGLLRVHSKGGKVATMPLPQDVGTAIAEYVREGRPATGSRVIFHRIDTPRTPFVTATPVILIARRALKRAGIEGLRSHHAHVFRHTFATMAIRSGVSLTDLAQVLRHKEPNTARIYAKLDTERLRSLSRPWLGVSR